MNVQPSQQRLTQLKQSGPLLGSAIVHVGLVLALTLLERTTTEQPQRPERVIPINLRAYLPPLEPTSAAADMPIEAPPDASAAEPEPQPQPQGNTEEPPALDDTDSVLSAESVQNVERAAAENSAQDRPPAIPSPPDVMQEASAEDAVAQDAPEPADDVQTEDWEAARQTAIANVVEALARDARYATFSMDDLPASGSGQNTPSEPNILNNGSRRKPARIGPQVGRARTRFGQTLTKLCNELSGGGIGLFGIAVMCTDPGERADLFGHLRPEYMNKLPVCTEEEGMRLAVETGGTEIITSIKCKLVPKEERPESISNFGSPF